MKIGVIDCDRKNGRNIFPNLALMKLAAWHKGQGDTVDWYDWSYADRVYIAKVFSWTPDYDGFLDAGEVIRGGSGYAIRLENGREVYDKAKDAPLPNYIEHIYPDYSLYNITDTAYGYLTRGCPRCCSFCHTAEMQGKTSHIVASLGEWWNGQKNICLLDPNIFACAGWEGPIDELIQSGATVDFSQGIDARLLTEEKTEALFRVKAHHLHFAWDRYEDKDRIVPKFRMVKEVSGWDRRRLIVYVLVGDREPRLLDTDLERVYTLRDLGLYPYVMIYNKAALPVGHELRRLQRWVNNRAVYETIKDFNDYKK